MAILVDSNIFISYYNNQDLNNKKAIELMSNILNFTYGDVLISDYIFNEIVTVFLARTKSLEKTKEIGELLINGEARIIKVDKIIFLGSWDLFTELNKKHRFSFTDCTNIILIKKYGIDSIATFDKEFRKLSGIKVVS